MTEATNVPTFSLNELQALKKPHCDQPGDVADSADLVD